MSTEAEDLGERIAEMAAHLDAATHTLLTNLRAYDRSGNWYQQGARTCAHWLSWRVGWSLNTARDHVRVAQRLADLPLIDDALRTGEVSYSKVRAMVRVATPANESNLLEDARHATGQQLEIICRKYAAVVRAATQVDENEDRKRRNVWCRDLADGMVALHAILQPDEAAAIMAAIEQIARERCKGVDEPTGQDEASPAMSGPSTSDSTSIDSSCTHSTSDSDSAATDFAATDSAATDSAATNSASTDSASQPPSVDATGSPAPPAQPRGQFNRADALVAMAQRVLRGNRPQRSPVELVVTVAAETLSSPSTAKAPFAVFADGTVVSAETARRLACDCGIVAITEGPNGAPLTVGRKTRSIPAPIKRAVLKRDKCCRFPGCSNRLYVEGHHVEHWADGGETKAANILSLCGYHHRFVHEYGYRVQLDEDGPRFFTPRGREVLDVPEPARPERLGLPAIIEMNEELEIDADTNQCWWDGSSPQYIDIIDALVRADQLQ